MAKTILTWALTALLAVFFAFVSYRKFSGNEVTASHFRDWGYGHWLLITVACLELTGALLLLFPATATIGAVLLSIVMIGASYTLLSHDVWKTSAITITSLVLLLLLGYLRWNSSWILLILRS